MDSFVHSVDSLVHSVDMHDPCKRSRVIIDHPDIHGCDQFWFSLTLGMSYVLASNLYWTWPVSYVVFRPFVLSDRQQRAKLAPA